MADLVPNEITMRDSDILNPNYSFDDKVTVAANVATSLKRVIDTQKLAVPIESKRGTRWYVTAEGWGVLGTMLGCTPYVEDVVEMSVNGKSSHYFAYKATVSIRHGETVLSRATAIAERNKMQNERFSVYSMAQTRALGKAYRMALSWIIKMAGYEPTPAEEMPTFNTKNVIEAEVVEAETVEAEAETVEEEIEEPISKKEFTTADKAEPLDVNPVIVTYAKNVAQEVVAKGRKLSQRTMLLKARGMVKRGEIPEEYCEELAEFIKINCPGDAK